MQNAMLALSHRTLLPTKKRVLHCLACGYDKLDPRERNYLLCTLCMQAGNQLARPIFDRAMRSVGWEGAQVSYRRDPNFQAAAALYRYRLQQAAIYGDAPNFEDAEVIEFELRDDEEEYDGPGAGELLTMLDAQHSGAEVSEVEFSAYDYLTAEESTGLDQMADQWALEQGVDLNAREAEEEIDLGEYRIYLETMAGAVSAFGEDDDLLVN